MTRLDGKVALVTGGSRGIGRSIAQRLAADGALVGVHYGTDGQAAKATLAEIADAGGRAFAARARLGVAGDADTLWSAFDAGLADQGRERGLDILVNNAGYALTKGALDTLTFTLAQQFGERGITVNAVAPGIVDVDSNATWLRDDPQALRWWGSFSAFNRVGQPPDIADVVAFFASDDSRWITGQYIDATGGPTCSRRTAVR